MGYYLNENLNFIYSNMLGYTTFHITAIVISFKIIGLYLKYNEK